MFFYILDWNIGYVVAWHWLIKFSHTWPNSKGPNFLPIEIGFDESAVPY
jgi:hypothetical protein